MCLEKLIGCFALVLIINIVEGGAWAKPYSEKEATGLLGTAAEEDSDKSASQEEKSDKGDSETEDYDEEGIMEEEFPEDEWAEEKTDREASSGAVREGK
ncbi:MAG: hypothetical protein ACE5KK_03035 [Candidatus Brocadiales bacterium]